MKTLQFRLRSLLLIVAIAALTFYAADVRRRRGLLSALGPRSGPFMVLVKTFRGPNAEQYASALAAELRTEYGLPSYLYSWRPTRRSLGATEAAGEVAVMVGDCQTEREASTLLRAIKKIRPKCFAGWPKSAATPWRPFCAPNPLIPVDRLYPDRVWRIDSTSKS
jgi:hypothetical protein